jgi:hypothetical protein
MPGVVQRKNQGVSSSAGPQSCGRDNRQSSAAAVGEGNNEGVGALKPKYAPVKLMWAAAQPR